MHGTWLEDYNRYFAGVFLGARAMASPVRSLVCEVNGTVRGFLGVMPVRMMLNGRPIVMAVCSQFAVDPAIRGQVGLRLLKACFEGPQDLTISDEAGDNTRATWEWCGGDTALLYSMRWVRPLRAAQFGLSVLTSRKCLGFLAGPCASGARMLDAAFGNLPSTPFRVSPPRGGRENLDERTLAGGWTSARVALRPDYDTDSAAWILARAGGRAGCGPVRKCLVRRESGDTAGWFIYCIGAAGRVADVLQAAARPGAAGDVLDHLLDDAMRAGAVAVSGRIEPALLSALSDRRAFFYHGNRWTLVHSRDAELRAAIHRGDAFLSRLEGEWCLRFP